MQWDGMGVRCKVAIANGRIDDARLAAAAASRLPYSLVTRDKFANRLEICKT